MQARVGKGLGGEASKFASEVEIFLILKSVDQFTCFTRAIKNGASEAEFVGQGAAIGADESAANIAIEHFAAVFAKGGFDARQRQMASITEVPACAQGGLAQLASGGVDPIQNGMKQAPLPRIMERWQRSVVG